MLATPQPRGSESDVRDVRVTPTMSNNDPAADSVPILRAKLQSRISREVAQMSALPLTGNLAERERAAMLLGTQVIRELSTALAALSTIPPEPARDVAVASWRPDFE